MGLLPLSKQAVYQPHQLALLQRPLGDVRRCRLQAQQACLLRAPVSQPLQPEGSKRQHRFSRPRDRDLAIQPLPDVWHLHPTIHSGAGYAYQFLRSPEARSLQLLSEEHQGLDATPELATETLTQTAGNYGTRDQVLALRPITDHIAALSACPTARCLSSGRTAISGNARTGKKDKE